MLTIITFIILLISLVYNSSIVIQGASRGLMLWYTNVLPILLPFMLVANVIVNKVNTLKCLNSSKKAYAILSTFLLGLLCGYPLGAKTTADYVKSNTFSKSTGNILLPVCNNCSPMFISGYVIHTILHDSISFPRVLFFIYTPYIVYTLFILFFTHLYHAKSNSLQCTIASTKDYSSLIIHKETDLIMTGIVQITYVGVYIMLCSIIIELINTLNFIPHNISPIICGITEITSGLSQIYFSPFNSTIKKALILGITSFGGISAILQTQKVIKKSGLSLIYYVAFKAICGISTFYLVLLFI